MKKPVPWLIGVSLLLVGYGMFATIRAHNLEQRVKTVEMAYKELQAKHLALMDSLLRATNASPLAAQHVKADLLRESVGSPKATVVEHAPPATELNGIPRSITSK